MSAWGTPRAPSSHPLPSLDLILQGGEWLARGRAGEALRCAEEALRQDPHDADALFLLGAAHYRDGDLAAAEARLKQAIQANGKVAVFHSTLGNVCQDRGAHRSGGGTRDGHRDGQLSLFPVGLQVG